MLRDLADSLRFKVSLMRGDCYSVQINPDNGQPDNQEYTTARQFVDDWGYSMGRVDLTDADVQCWLGVVHDRGALLMRIDP